MIWSAWLHNTAFAGRRNPVAPLRIPTRNSQAFFGQDRDAVLTKSQTILRLVKIYPLELGVLPGRHSLIMKDRHCDA